MNKLSLRDINVAGKRVLTRVDFNVPIKNGKVTDDSRIVAALPTIRHIIEHGGIPVLLSHLGRPDGIAKPEFSLKPVAEHLATLLGRKVTMASDCTGKEVAALVHGLKPGDVVLLENVRYHAEEELLNKYKKQDDATKARIDQFVKDLAALGDVYVNDAFGTAHRAHGSTQGVTKYFKENACGFLMEKEIQYFGKALSNPDRPFVAIIGGAKVSDKIEVLSNLITKVDSLLIGGAMAYTFLKARGIETGKSLVEEDKIELARQIMAQAAERKVALLLPIDHVVADSIQASAPLATGKNISAGQMGVDIGPETIALFEKSILGAKTIIWNGPMGVFENPAFARGTFAIASAMAESSAVTIIGGGDSVAAVNKSGVADRMSHISTGGGASLEFMEGKVLPGVAALTDRR